MSFPLFMTKQQQYLFIKQKLDWYNISTVFPLQMMPLLQNLLVKLDEQVYKNRQSGVRVYKNSLGSQSAIKQYDLAYKHLDSALRLQTSKIMNENNLLHIQIIGLKQQIQSLKHCLNKWLIQKSDNKQQIRHVLQYKDQKQRQLFEQLQVVKYKYNQLVDFVLGQDNLQKNYIKKLLNHHKYHLNQQGNYQRDNYKFQNHNNNQLHQINNNINQLEQQNNNKAGQDLNSRITFKANKQSSSRIKSSRKRINQTIEHKPSQSKDQNHQYTLNTLKSKLINRQKQIQRLQAVITHNGPNLNKVLTQFNHQLQQKRHSQTQQRLTFLQNQNHKLKRQLEKSKTTGGRYQALRQQVDKCHQIINQLKQQNQQIKRTKKQHDFDLQKQKKQIHRSLKHFNNKNAQLKVSKYADDLTIQELKKKVQFYQKQVGVKNSKVQKPKQKTKKVGKRSVNLKDNGENKECRIDKDKRVQKNVTSSQLRQKYEDQIKLTQKLQKKVIKSLQKGSKVQKQVKKRSPKKNNQINQIPQQSQQEQSQINEQQEDVNRVQNKEQNNQQQQNNNNQLVKQNKNNQQQQQQQQQLEQQMQQQKNDTLIGQYKETISELSRKCLQLKQQLQLKNNAIKGLQQIATRLMNKQQLTNQQNNNKQKQQFSDNNNNHSDKRYIKQIRQIKKLQQLLNESQFQKQQLRRQLINIQSLYKQINNKNQQQIHSQHQINHNIISQIKQLQFNRKQLEQKIQKLEQKIQRLQKTIEQKDKKIQDIRQDNVHIQDKLLKSLDRIRRLNDQIQLLTKQKQLLTKQNKQLTKQNKQLSNQNKYLNDQNKQIYKNNEKQNSQKQKLIKQLQLNQQSLQQASKLLKQQRQRHSNTIQLSQIQKDQIIILRKNLLLAHNKISQLQHSLQQLTQINNYQQQSQEEQQQQIINNKHNHNNIHHNHNNINHSHGCKINNINNKRQNHL